MPPQHARSHATGTDEAPTAAPARGPTDARPSLALPLLPLYSSFAFSAATIGGKHAACKLMLLLLVRFQQSQMRTTQQNAESGAMTVTSNTPNWPEGQSEPRARLRVSKGTCHCGYCLQTLVESIRKSL